MERTLKNQKSVSDNICNDLLIKIRQEQVRPRFRQLL
jgi:hypothetical protein